MFGKRFSRALVVMTVASLVTATAAFADNAVADGDGLAAVANNDMAVGPVACSTPTQKTALIAVSRNGNAGSPNVFKDGSTVTVSVLSVTGTGLSASMGASNTIAIPSGWGDLDNNTMSASVAATVTVNSSTPGAGSGTVTFRATGVNSSNTTVTRDDPMTVSWTTGTCVVADTTNPINAAITINSGDAWTNDPNVSLALSANDNVGIVGYALAESSAALPTTPSASVTPTTSFSAPAVSFSLTAGDASAKPVHVRFFDAAGNHADVSDTIGLDTVKPTITADTNGYTVGTWTNQDVTVDFSCADNAGGSDIDTDTVAGETVSTEGATNSVTNTGDCIDNAGNAADAVTVSPIKIDKTKPSVAIDAPNDGLTTLASSVTVAGTASDSLSGLASVKVNSGSNLGTSGSFSTSVTLVCGANTITATAEDNAGNSESTSITVTKACFSGLRYYQPIDQSTSTVVVNSGKLGRVIPVKVTLSLNGSPVTPSVLADNGWTLQIGVNSATCSSGAANDFVEQYADAGMSNAGTNLFRWDSTSQQWIYNLDTGSKAGTGVSMTLNGCYRLDVYVSDGTTKMKVSDTTYAVFKPTK